MFHIAVNVNLIVENSIQIKRGIAITDNRTLKYQLNIVYVRKMMIRILVSVIVILLNVLTNIFM